MPKTRTRSWVLSAGRAWTLVTICGAVLMTFGGCLPCPLTGVRLFLRGKVLDAETLRGATDAAVGGRTFTEGEETDRVSPLIYDGSATFPPPEEDGTFQVEFNLNSPSCGPPILEFPRPDQVEVIVVRDGCEQTFIIEINEDTVVDMDFPDDVIELKDPILVGPCEE